MESIVESYGGLFATWVTYEHQLEHVRPDGSNQFRPIKTNQTLAENVADKDSFFWQ